MFGPMISGGGGGGGADGKSAYQLWLDAGNVGTLEDFLASLIGPAGADGAPGAPGADGEDGAQGIQGVKGDKGDQGNTGSQGIQGIQGIPGTNGTNGTNGAQGPAGQMQQTYAGDVTQLTNKSTGVTLNALYGQITTTAAALAAATSVSFTLTNSQIAANDMVIVTYHGGTVAGRGQYTINASPSAGSAVITLRNNSAASRSDVVIIRFAVLKGV